MVCKFVIAFVALTYVVYVSGSECEYCRGFACDEESIPIVPCENHPKRLPYQLKDESINFHNQTNTCVSLVYLNERKVKLPIKQCWIQTQNLCKKVSSSLPSKIKLEKCVVINADKTYIILEKFGQDKKIDPKNDEIDEESDRSTDSTTENWTVTTEIVETTTEGRSTMAVISLATFSICIFVQILLQ